MMNLQEYESGCVSAVTSGMSFARQTITQTQTRRRRLWWAENATEMSRVFFSSSSFPRNVLIIACALDYFTESTLRQDIFVAGIQAESGRGYFSWKFVFYSPDLL